MNAENVAETGGLIGMLMMVLGGAAAVLISVIIYEGRFDRRMLRHLVPALACAAITGSVTGVFAVVFHHHLLGAGT